MTKSQAKRWLLDHYNDPENELMPQEETDDVLTALGYDVADLASGGGIESQGDMRWDVLSQEMMDAKKEFEDEEGEDEDSEEFGESVKRRASRMIESVKRGADINTIVEESLLSRKSKVTEGREPGGYARAAGDSMYTKEIFVAMTKRASGELVPLFACEDRQDCEKRIDEWEKTIGSTTKEYWRKDSSYIEIIFLF